MCITEFDEAEYNDLLRAECEAKGREEGKEEGVITTLIGFIRDGLITEENAAKKANMTVEKFQKAEAKYKS